MRTANARPTLIVMVKDPMPGRVKTRLGRDIGMSTAAWWFRHQTQRLIRNTRDRRWQSVLALAPDRAVATSRNWPADLWRTPQGIGDLGGRMTRALQYAMPGPVLLIGGDIPGITALRVARAFRTLKHHDAVLGPAPDGGFWCIGLAGPLMPRNLFANARWSTEHALLDTLVSLHGKRVALTETLSDVDIIDDLAPGAIHATPLSIHETGVSP